MYCTFIHIAAMAIKCIACTQNAHYAPCENGDEGRKHECPSNLYNSCKKEINGKDRIELVVQRQHINIYIYI